MRIPSLRIIIVGFAAAIACLMSNPSAAEMIDFNNGWQFMRSNQLGAEKVEFNNESWQTVTLPHTAQVEPLVMVDPQWQGICWYRKNFPLPASVSNKVVILKFEGAMNTAEIWVNGESVGTFMGGYLPYVMDISESVQPGSENVIAVKLDNRDNPTTGPKPLKDLDFNLYSGLYRPVQLIIKDKLHITDPILADKTASGGLFVTFPRVRRESATVRVQTHVMNSDHQARHFRVKTTLMNEQGSEVASETTALLSLGPTTDEEFIRDIEVVNPKLWSPGSPILYTVRSELLEDGRVVDSEDCRIGIRQIEVTADGFVINGEKQFLRGANRHQDYPYIGNALPDAAQYRDALKIKQAGFDYVRLSHYPQSPAFLDACDELGLVVMDCLMGWQYFNADPKFSQLKYEECRQMIRRDRNHPCVILWEVSLNESRMPDEFIKTTHAIAHEEYPGDQCYTCGWTQGYDVFLQARQHGGCKGITNQPCVISEYGDWEYYAQNAGLAQHLWNDLQPAERSSRQLRGEGEVRLLQQAMNFQEAHNDNLKTTAFADGLWVMFDYNRGYAPDIEASGVMDIFRLPKFGYWFFRSQRDPQERVLREPVGAMVHIASDWTVGSPPEVRVFSNCDEVALYLNERLIDRQKPDHNRVSTHLKHPPFTFSLEQFEPGTLRAVGYIDSMESASHERQTPGDAASLRLRVDLGGHPFAAQGKDVIFCYADVVDGAGTVLPNAGVPVFFGPMGGSQLIGANPILSEAGTASILLQDNNTDASVFALCLMETPKGTRIFSSGASLVAASQPDFTIHFTTNGLPPTLADPVYEAPISESGSIKAGLFVGDHCAVVADSRNSAPSTGFLASQQRSLEENDATPTVGD